MTAHQPEHAGALDVMVVGGGVYVTGEDGSANAGTIMPALLEARRGGYVDRLAMVTTSHASAQASLRRAIKTAEGMGVDDQCDAFPADPAAACSPLAAAEAFKPDAAIVSVPDHLHAACAVPLIEAGIPCLVVKPLAGSVVDARRLAAAAEAAGVVAQVEFHKRLDQSNLMLREAVRSGRLGDPLYATVEYSQRKTIPRDAFRNWAADSNIFQYLGVHYVDLIMWATGFRPVWVSAWGQRGYLQDLGLDVCDAMQVVIEWDRGDGGTFVSTHVSNWIDPDESSAMSDQKINMVGSGGRYQADQKNRGVQVLVDGQGVQDVNPYFTAAWRGDDGLQRFHGYGIDSVHQFLTDVLAVRAGEISVDALNRIRPSFADGVVSTAVVAAATASLSNGSIPTEVTT